MSESSKPPEVALILSESVLQSWMRDIWSVASGVCLMGIGWWLSSTAMEWAGFVLFWILLLGRGHALKLRLTPQQAANKLFEKYGVRAE